MEGLRDPYEANRHICLQILQALPVSKNGLIVCHTKFSVYVIFVCCYYLLLCIREVSQETATVEELVGRYFLLVKQPKSVSCASASCLLKLMMTHCNPDFNLYLFKTLSKCKICRIWQRYPFTSDFIFPLFFFPSFSDLSSVVVEPPLVEDPHSISTLKLLCQMLDSHIILARTDLSTASMSAPMYGLVQSMRSVIEQGLSDANSVSFKHNLHHVTGRMVLLCKSLSDIVSPIVCSSSPEGFFPDVVAPHQGTVAAAAAAGGRPLAPGNAQSLLLCCWHTMKEISLLLGVLVENFCHVGVLEGVGVVLSDDDVC